MINHADIENIIGCKTLVTDRMQQAIEGGMTLPSTVCPQPRPGDPLPGPACGHLQ